jgi:hypothetical protein
VSFFCVSNFSSAALNDREKAKFIHDRLTGVLPSAVMLTEMEDIISLNNGGSGAFDAALVAIDGNNNVDASGAFYNVTVKNWASPWTNEEDDIFAPLNDYSALVIGLVRDEEDFSLLLSGDILYLGADSSLPSYAMNNNNHYQQLESSGANLGDSSVFVKTTQSSQLDIDPRGIAGFFSTRAAAKAFFSDGTNRAM